MRDRRRVLSALIVTAAAAAAAVVAFAMWSWRPTGALVDAQAPTPSYVVTSPTTYTGERDAIVRVTRGPARHLFAPAFNGGTVTKAPICEPGAEVEEGDTVFAVDGVDRIGVATAEPLFRVPGEPQAMTPRLLAEVLRRLGYLADDGEEASAAEIRSGTEALLDRSGVTTEGLPVPDVLVWLPAPTASVQSCSIELGGRVDAGATIAGLTSLAFDARVVDFAPRISEPMVVQLDSGTVDLHPDGAIVDPHEFPIPADDVTTLATDATVVEVPVSMRLAKPIDVLSVPAAAVLAHNTTCVLARSAGSDFEPVPVDVIDSEFGIAVVAVHDAPIPREVMTNPRRAAAEVRCDD